MKNAGTACMKDSPTFVKDFAKQLRERGAAAQSARASPPMSLREGAGSQGLPQILLIEDAESQAEVTMWALAQANPPPDVQWFASAEDAIDFLTMQGTHAQRQPGLPLLVLSDVHLPNVSGLDLLRRIRDIPALYGLPILMMSAAASAEELALCYQHGATGYIDKLTDFADFRQRLLSTVVFWLQVNRLPDDWRRRSSVRA